MERKLLEASIISEFPTVTISQIIHNENESIYKFTGINIDDCYNDEGVLDNIMLIARQDGFFWNVHNIKRMMENCGFNVDIDKNPISEINNRVEATLYVNLPKKKLYIRIKIK